MPQRERRIYRGTSFQVWQSDSTWFWFFAEGGAIGATACEAQAVVEAEAAIDQLMHDQSTKPRRIGRAGVRARNERGWQDVLDSLADYLATA